MKEALKIIAPFAAGFALIYWWQVRRNVAQSSTVSGDPTLIDPGSSPAGDYYGGGGGSSATDYYDSSGNFLGAEGSW